MKSVRIQFRSVTCYVGLRLEGASPWLSPFIRSQVSRNVSKFRKEWTAIFLSLVELFGFSLVGITFSPSVRLIPPFIFLYINFVRTF